MSSSAACSACTPGDHGPACWAAAHFPLNHPSEVASLVKTLHGVGAHDQLTALAGRLPAARKFDEFLRIGDHQERFAFGREPDGNAAAPWSWENLN